MQLSFADMQAAVGNLREELTAAVSVAHEICADPFYSEYADVINRAPRVVASFPEASVLVKERAEIALNELEQSIRTIEAAFSAALNHAEQEYMNTLREAPTEFDEEAVDVWERQADRYLRQRRGILQLQQRFTDPERDSKKSPRAQLQEWGHTMTFSGLSLATLRSSYPALDEVFIAPDPAEVYAAAHQAVAEMKSRVEQTYRLIDSGEAAETIHEATAE